MISISSSPLNKDYLQFSILKMGRVTSALHEMQVEDIIGIRGPYGNSFPIEKWKGKNLIFIGGGIGLAPMRSLVQHCLFNRNQFGKLTLLYGAKNPEEFLFVDEFDSWRQADDFDLQLIVDVGDAGWSGPVGLITQLIPPLDIDVDKSTAVLVGPPVMYRFVIQELHKKNMKDELVN